MLILEIAAGIVLAVLVLAFWPFILAGAVVIGLLIFVASQVSTPPGTPPASREAPVVYRQTTERETRCLLRTIRVNGRQTLTEAEIEAEVKRGGFSAQFLNPECVLDGPVTPQAATRVVPAAETPVGLLNFLALLTLAGVVAAGAWLFPRTSWIGYRVGWLLQRLRRRS